MDCKNVCPNVGKYGPEKTLYLVTFHAVGVLILNKEVGASKGFMKA